MHLCFRIYAVEYSNLTGNFQFIGCMTNMTLNGKRLDLSYPGDDVKTERLISECTSCNPTPCYNKGTCVEEPGLTYSCRCPTTFTGSVCDIPGKFCLLRTIIVGISGNKSLSI